MIEQPTTTPTTEPANQSGQTTEATQPADNTPAPAPADDWKSSLSEHRQAFLKEGITKEDYVKELEKGYDSLSSKLGEKKEGLLGEVPKDPSEYKFESEDVQDWYKDLAHKSNLTNDQANNLQKSFDEHINNLMKEQETKFTEELKTKWGDNYDDKLAKAKEFFAENLTEESRDKLNNLGNMELLLLTEVADSLREKYMDNGSLPQGGNYAGATLDALEAEKLEIMRSPEYQRGSTRGNELDFAQKQNRLLEINDKIFNLKNKG